MSNHFLFFNNADKVLMKFLILMLLFINFSDANENSVFNFDYYSSRCQKQDNALRDCIDKNYDIFSSQHALLIDNLEKTKSKLFDHHYQKSSLPILINAAKLQYLQRISEKLKKEEVLLKVFGSEEDSKKFNNLKQITLKKCQRNKETSQKLNQLFSLDLKIKKTPEIEAAKNLYLKKIRMALFELYRIELVQNKYSKDSKHHDFLNHLNKRKENLYENFPVLLQMSHASLKKSIFERFITRNNFSMKKFLRSEPYFSKEINSILYENLEESSSPQPIGEDLKKYRENFNKTAFEEDLDSWERNLLEKYVKSEIGTSVKAIGEICDLSPCETINIDPYFVSDLIDSLQNKEEKEVLLNTICNCEIRKKEKDLESWKYLVMGGVSLGTGVACFFSAPVCLTGVGLSILSANLSWDEYKKQKKNTKKIERTSLLRNYGLTDSKLQLKTLEDLHSQENLAMTATVFLFMDVLPSGAFKSFKKGASFFKKSDVPFLQNIKKSPIIKSFKDQRDNYVIKIDLRKTIKEDETSQKAKNFANEYWDFTGNYYKKRLDLKPDEIQLFIKSSYEMNPRTLLIANIGNSRNEIDFKGGIATVFSKNQSENLPLEKSLGIKIPRGPPETSIAEIVRFTANDPENKNLSKDLLKSLSSHFESSKDVNKIYVFTSKIHHRLYERLKIKHKVLSENDVKILEEGKWNKDRDIIMEITREDFVSALKD